MPVVKETMANLNLPKSVKQVLILDNSGKAGSPVVVYGAENKKKGSKFWRPIEKAARRMAKGQAAAASSYLERHERSNNEEKDGWVHDVRTNFMKSVKAGRKAAKAKD
jgi:hypothetical protein